MKNYFAYVIAIVSIIACNNIPEKEIPADTRLKDYDGNVYDTVRLGSQLWMKQNLRTTHYNDGTPITHQPDDSLWRYLAMEAYTIYDHDADNDSIYGKLYNWYAVNSGKLAPVGWHISTVEDWDTLFSFLTSDTAALGKIRETGTEHWAAPNTGATNITKLTVLPAGNHSGLPGGPAFAGLHFYTGFWTPDEYNTDDAWVFNVQATHVKVDQYYYKKTFGLSVRCVKD